MNSVYYFHSFQNIYLYINAYIYSYTYTYPGNAELQFLSLYVHAHKIIIASQGSTIQLIKESTMYSKTHKNFVCKTTTMIRVTFRSVCSNTLKAKSGGNTGWQYSGVKFLTSESPPTNLYMKRQKWQKWCLQLTSVRGKILYFSSLISFRKPVN